MESSLVTIVLPVYGVEKYLDRCVESIVNQTYSNLEIFLVDDASPDRCPEMCDEWAMRDPRIRVIHKPVNEGLGMARNTGIENAKGEYIFFFDSDDYVEQDVVEQCVDVIETEKAELVCFGYDSITPQGEKKQQQIPMPPQSTFSGSEIREKLIPRLVSYDAKNGEKWYLSLSACFQLFSMELIRSVNWRFVSEREIISEDFYSMLSLYFSVNKVVFIPKVFYHYTINEKSLARSYREDRYEKLRYFTQQMMLLGRNNGCNIEAEVATMFLNMLMSHLKQIASCTESLFNKLQSIREVVNDDYLQNTLRNNDFSGDSLTKRVLYCSMKRRSAFACWLLATLRNLKG